MTDTVRDKTGREIKRGDIVKVYHFTGARRKRYYMYKQAMGWREWPSGWRCMAFSHLDMTDDVYYEEPSVLMDYEIVQGAHDDHEDRERVQ